MREENQRVRTDNEVKNSILTTADRKFLQSNIRNTSNSTTRRSRIRERVREGLRDFRILSDCLEDRDREQIFGTDGYQSQTQLQNDVTAAIAFLYAGVGGESGFRQPLVRGVQIGESRLRNLKRRFSCEPRFAVDFVSHTDRKEAVEAVREGKWDRLSHRSLFDVIQLAHNAGAIDYDRLENMATYVEHIPGAGEESAVNKE
jgi:hypothetical protein